MNRFISISKRFSNQSSILTKMNRQNNNVLFCHHYSTSLMNQTDFPINSFSNRFSSLSNRNSIQTRNYAKKSKKKGAGGGKKKRKKGAGEGDPNNIVITLHDIEKHFRDGVQIFSNVTMGAFHGAKIGVVGVNGAGKSCLLKIIAGVDEDFEGERIIKDGYKIGYLAQEPKLDETKDVKGNVLDGIADKLEMLERHSELSEKIKNEEADEDEIEEHKKLKFSCDALQLWGLDKRIYKAMDALRCPPPESSLENLSGGERRRVALCQLLVSQPDILLLDEPTNHLDANSVAWLQTYLQGYRGTVIAITHDRYFLDGCAGWIAELDRGRMIPFQGNYTEWLQAKAIRLQQEAKRDKNREKMLNKELEWINSPQKARQAKSRARVTAYEERLNEAKAKPYESGTIVIPPGRRLGGVVLEVKGLSKSFGDRKLFDNVSFELKAGQILGIIGANGTGKTSLLRILTGEDEADSGTVRIGETVDLGYVTQSRDSLDSENTVFEEIAGQSSEIDLGSHVVNSRAYVAAFNFSGDAQQKRVGNLSGGERNRVHLAKMIQRAPNVLLLDEPTNDLDVEVLRNLENSLADFTGSGVVVSHDRWFLDRVCTHILELGQEEVEVYEGTFAQYEEFMKEQNKKTALSGEKKSVSRSAFRKLGI